MNVLLFMNVRGNIRDKMIFKMKNFSLLLLKGNIVEAFKLTRWFLLEEHVGCWGFEGE